LKVAALLCGILATAFAWAATYYVADLSVDFVALWPQTNTQQLLGLAVWYGLLAAPVLGGLVAVVLPTLGGLLLIAAAAGWIMTGLLLPAGLSPQIAVPAVLSGLGVLASIAAIVRGFMRRAALRRPPSLAEMAREEALRLDPDVDFRLEVERRNNRDDDDEDDRRARPASAAANVVQPPPRQALDTSAPRGLSGLFVANVVTLALLTIAVGALLYANLRNGQLAAAFGGPQTIVSAPLTTPVAEVGAAPALNTAASAVAKVAEIPEAEVSVSSSPLDLATLPPLNWSDPFAYCAAVRTVDFPDRRYAGPALTDAIASALKVPASSSPDRVKWRCFDGALLGCTSFSGASCALTPTVAEMRDYCLTHPNATGLSAPNGTWGCADSTPEIPRGASWPIDPRGFLPGAWVEITSPARRLGTG